MNKRNTDALVKKAVIPVKTGIQKTTSFLKNWIPAYAGMTVFVGYCK